MNYLTIAEAADLIGMPQSELEQEILSGGGPLTTKVPHQGTSILLQDLLLWRVEKLADDLASFVGDHRPRP